MSYEGLWRKIQPLNINWVKVPIRWMHTVLIEYDRVSIVKMHMPQNLLWVWSKLNAAQKEKEERYMAYEFPLVVNKLWY